MVNIHARYDRVLHTVEDKRWSVRSNIGEHNIKYWILENIILYFCVVIITEWNKFGVYSEEKKGVNFHENINESMYRW